jgi:outer membrane receptor protein involved in Fe transport
MIIITSSLAVNAFSAEEVTEEKQIERIFIIGSKQELTLQEVDASVELFTEERLNAERIIDLKDALIRVPNLTSIGASNNITIRGIGRTGATSAGQGVTSNVYVDGSPLSETVLSRSSTSLWDTKQVEVLRGSQSSIQGRNALAGAIVITTADPTYTPEGKVRLSYAENNTFQIAGAYSNAIVDNQLAFRLAADIQETDGFINTLDVDKNPDYEERLLLRGKLLFQPKAIDELTIKLTIDHNDALTGESRPVVNTPFQPSDAEYTSFNPLDYISTGRFVQNDIKSTRVILDTHYALSDNWSIKSIFTHEDTDVEREFNFADRLGESFFDFYAFNQFDEKINTAELRFTFDYDNITGVIGGYYFDGENDERTFNDVLLDPEVASRTLGFGSVAPADTATLGLSNRTITNTKNKAVFAQVRIELDEFWTLDVGLRYDNEKFENSGVIESIRLISPDECIATVPGFLIGSDVTQVQLDCTTLVNAVLGEELADETPQAAKYNAWLPKLALTYKLNEDHSVFASAQRGYRAGGSYLTRVSNTNGVGNIQVVDTYTPEYLNTVEVGTRSIFSDGDITLNTNIFYSKYKDQQVNLPGDDLSDAADDLIVNAAESSISGIEVSFEYFISQEFNIYASLGLLKAEFDDFPFVAVGEFSNLKGKKQPSSPNVNASLGANWKNGNGLFANLSVFYTGTRFSNVENLDNDDLFQPAIDAGASLDVASNLTEEIDAYVNVNLRFGYEMDELTLYAYVTNILDENVITSHQIAGVDQATGEIGFATGGSTVTVLPPRTVGIGIDYSF